MSTWLEEQWSRLNQYQRDAVADDSMSCMVNANVGSGKTTVLLAKLQYLHEHAGISYEDMAVLTFTNKAAGEIRQRLVNQTQALGDLEQIGTFHSVALYFLKHKLPVGELGWNEDFSVIEPDEELLLIQELIDTHKLKIKYKNRLRKRLEQEYATYCKGGESKYQDDLFSLYALLEEEKKRRNVMNFDDLLTGCTTLLEQNPKHIRWILVDEVQDCNRMQANFLQALKGRETGFFAVGDPNQVIYSWRGGTESMFYYIKNMFAAKELTLPINYRSSNCILQAAAKFMQYGNGMEGVRHDGEKIKIKNHYDPFQEAQYLVERIRQLHHDGIAYSSIAIFYRMQKQSELIEDVFTREQIPFLVVKKAVVPPEGKEQQRELPLPLDLTEPESPTEAVRLMTLHASKGLEFSCVFIIGVNNGLIPMRGKSYEDEEEERRLFFVGMTRAKDELELSYYTEPALPFAFSGPGNFLRMIPAELTESDEMRSQQEKRENLQQLRRSVEQRRESTKPKEIKVSHPKYGEGILVKEEDMMVEVEFTGYGKKQFLKAFSELTYL